MKPSNRKAFIAVCLLTAGVIAVGMPILNNFPSLSGSYISPTQCRVDPDQIVVNFMEDDKVVSSVGINSERIVWRQQGMRKPEIIANGYPIVDRRGPANFGYIPTAIYPATGTMIHADITAACYDCLAELDACIAEQRTLEPLSSE